MSGTAPPVGVDATPAYGSIVRLVWPLALGMINNAVMQFVDRAFLARESMLSLEASLPASALAGVFIGFFQSVVGYSGVLVAQYHGAGDAVNCRASYRAGLLIAAVSGLLMLPLLPLGWWLFALSSPSDGLFASERAYYDIVMLGSVFLYGQMAASSFFTGRGRTRLVFWVNLVGNLLNIALDPVFIFTLGMGIRGAAVATVLSQLVLFAVLFRVACGPAEVPVSAAVRRLPSAVVSDRTILRRILGFGVPAGGYEVLNMLSFTVFVFVTETVGGVEFAVSNACFTVCYLLFAPMTGFAVGVQTLVGQFRGMGDDARARAAVRRALVLGLGFCLATVVVVMAFNRQILELFAPADPGQRAAFIELGVGMTVILAAWILFDALDTILSGALKGAGDTRFVFWWMMFSAFVVWLPLVFLVKFLGGSMLWLWSTMLVYVIVISAGSLIRWRSCRWKHIRVVGS